MTDLAKRIRAARSALVASLSGARQKTKDAPFGTRPHATRDEYLRLFEAARTETFPVIDDCERKFGFAIDRTWLDEVALHTQIVIKKSPLNYQHGRLLYSALRGCIADNALDFVTIVETGTARGFSALTMSKAIDDAGIDGRIITIDVLPHLKRMIWNCIDDHDGPKSRAEILAPWSRLARRIFFMEGDTLSTLPRFGLDRVHFAFLDAEHEERNVLAEFGEVRARQTRGDMVLFDDVTPALFPGVVAAVDRIEEDGEYEVERLRASETRAYAWATRTA